MSDDTNDEKRQALAKALTALSTSTSSTANVAGGIGGLGGLGGLRPGLINSFLIPPADTKGIAGLRLDSIVNSPPFVVNDALLASYQTLREQKEDATRKVEESRVALQKAATTEKEQRAAIQSLEANIRKLEAVNHLGFLLSRVCPEAQQRLMKSEKFQKLFLEPAPCKTFVMSMDIRRSTELMLKAKSPEHFSQFITTLCEALVEIVQASFGVLDKFTGDGILAFYPDFYSGDDAGYSAIAAADKCHEIFCDHYKKSRTSFTSVLMDVGLGIGIDYGEVHLIQMAGGLTVVGKPVVYACRLSAAPAGLTYINQPAYEEISMKFSKYCLASECVLDIKHEGRTLAYATQLTKHAYDITHPAWPSD